METVKVEDKQKSSVLDPAESGNIILSFYSAGLSSKQLGLTIDEHILLVDVKTRVDAVWEQMNKGTSSSLLQSICRKRSPNLKETKQKSSSNWKSVLGLAEKKIVPSSQDRPEKIPDAVPNDTGVEAKKLAAAALEAVKNAAAAAANGRGKVEITEMRDFAGHDIEVKKFVDADSKEAFDRANSAAPSAVDAVLEQIKKKPKLSVLDKTKKDWGEFKEENKGLEDELDTYKKSSNQYLDKVSFLQRTDYREFERERDARLAMQARRKTDMREDP
ncbi:hypothetical protein SAY87_030485 [Trapa incisa]|uniref:BCNT-C domain-containing protein n=1 Tax=Trapa incisa TaxID=236973 RepID=A0AAN7QLU5_9MYRT|nr:hypothetical protein SAY87_030485 [Trapa incisa]